MQDRPRNFGLTTAAPQVLPRAALRRPRLNSMNRLSLIAAGLVVLLAVGLVGLTGALYGYFTLFERILPGVRVGNISLSGMSVEAAAAKLEAEWTAANGIRLSDGARSWAVTAGELGFTLDARATAEAAYWSGRDASGWPAPFGMLRRPEPVVAKVVFQSEVARARLVSAAALVNVPAVDAAVRFADGQWSAVPGKDGLALAVEETLAAWSADHAGALAGGVLRVETRAVAPAVRDATAQAEQLNAMLRMPLQISAFDPVTGETLDITVPTEALAQMVRVSESGGQPQISLDEAALQAYLQNWQGDLGAERYLDEEQGLENLAQNWQSGAPLQALVRYYPTQYTVQPGDTLLSISYEIGIPWFLIRDANPGSGTNGLVAGEQITLPAKDANLPLPVVRGKRIVISISQQRLWSYENGQLRTQSVISTGIARSPTMPGVFQVRSHEINAYASNWDLWMPNFMGIYEASPGFMNGIHGLPLLSSGVRLWGDVLGSPASYGCIIMTLQEAEELYNWADEGTVVEIQP